jgi:hypothetical protein
MAGSPIQRPNMQQCFAPQLPPPARLRGMNSTGYGVPVGFGGPRRAAAVPTAWPWYHPYPRR